MTIKNFIKKHLRKIIKFPASKRAYKLLNGLKGIEIGASAQCDFMLDTINIDVSKHDSPDDVYNREQKRFGHNVRKVDVVASGDNLPFEDESFDFVISSHVLEHFFDPVKALKEWYRVIKPDGYIFMIIPHKMRTFDRNKKRTSLQELIDRHEGRIDCAEFGADFHHSIWILEDVLELCRYLNFNVIEYYDKDDNVGNGFTIIIQKKGKKV